MTARGARSLVALGLCLVGSQVLDPRAAHAQNRPPNIVLILADDLGWGDVGFNGRKDWPTPNLDRLARQGTVFRRWYCGSVTCAPSRAVLMTGRYGIHNGVTANNDDLPAKEVTIAEALKERGYVTGLFGKWHHGLPRPGGSHPSPPAILGEGGISYVHPMDQGFDEFFGFTDATDAHQKYPKQLWFGREQGPVIGYCEIQFTDHALDFLRRNRARPFFLHLTYTNPHFNIDAPPEDVARFMDKFPEKDSSKPFKATYAAMVWRLDQEVGRVLRELDSLGLSKDTLVVFTSDHGATFEVGNQGASAFHDSNRPFRGQKRTLWEGGIRVPGIVRWPGRVPAGRVSDEIVHFADVLPTLLAVGGTAPDPAWKVDGMNLLHVWQGKGHVPERTLFWEWRSEGANQAAAMRGDLKLVITGENRPELYDVVRDPAERRSIIAEQPVLARQLEQELKTWLATESDEAKWGKPVVPTRDRGR